MDTTADFDLTIVDFDQSSRNKFVDNIPEIANLYSVPANAPTNDANDKPSKEEGAEVSTIPLVMLHLSGCISNSTAIMEYKQTFMNT
jgi:hypothetical protein